MIKFAPRGQLGLQHLFLISAITIGGAIDLVRGKEEKKHVPHELKVPATNMLNTAFTMNKK